MDDKKSFEEKLMRLEEIVKLIEDENTSLEESVDLYSEAAKLAAECNKTLDQAELTLKEIKADSDDQ